MKKQQKAYHTKKPMGMKINKTKKNKFFASKTPNKGCL